MAHRVHRSACDDGCLFGSHASEVMHFDDLSKRLILASQGVQRVVQLQHLQWLAPALVDGRDVLVPWDPVDFSDPSGRVRTQRSCRG
jgi:hypothetical protein